VEQYSKRVPAWEEIATNMYPDFQERPEKKVAIKNIF
jgi:hypothetical protein